jgi:predicted enzyme involved in methoxymalonyl-ACP biosynthesis
VAGKRVADTLEVSTWVMSCRAFSRRIEFHTLECLFESSGARNIALAFRATERNGPTQEFLASIGANGAGPIVLDRRQFAAAQHDLPHRVSIVGAAKR